MFGFFKVKMPSFQLAWELAAKLTDIYWKKNPIFGEKIDGKNFTENLLFQTLWLKGPFPEAWLPQTETSAQSP